MTPFTHLIQKDQPFSWGVEVENAFQSLKASFTIAPLLIHVNPSKPFVLEMDIFYFALGAILSQPKEDNFFHLVGFDFHKNSVAKDQATWLTNIQAQLVSNLEKAQRRYKKNVDKHRKN
jgi:hypothetical protein